MKLDKTQQKELNCAVINSAKQIGYKSKSNSIYVVKGQAFIHCDFLIVESKKMVYRLYVKQYLYDNIFWKILDMSDNANKNDSLRACGAFKAPSALIESGEMELEDNFEAFADRFICKITKLSSDFLEKYNIDEYIISYERHAYIETLKCLAYLNMGCEIKAKEIAKKAIDDGNDGDFINEGKGFFERLMEHF